MPMCHGIAAAAGKAGAFAGTYALAALLPSIGLEDLTENPHPASAVALGLAESRGRPARNIGEFRPECMIGPRRQVCRAPI